MQENLTAHAFSVDRKRRSELKNQRAATVWLTGLSGAGKSTIANALELALAEAGYHTYLLDGDNIRLGLCSDLAFSNGERKENIRRVAEVANLFVDAGIITIIALISPFAHDRELARGIIGAANFIEVYIDTPLSECERRDPKGLYDKARRGLIPDFTGIHSAYEPPSKPDITIRTQEETLPGSIIRIKKLLDSRCGLLTG